MSWQLCLLIVQYKDYQGGTKVEMMSQGAGKVISSFNAVLYSHFLQEGAYRNLSEIKFLANPRSLSDVLY